MSFVAQIIPDPNVLLSELDDGTGVLLHLNTKFYFVLNRTGVFVWNAIQDAACRTPERIAERLAAVFETTPEAAQRDVDALVREMSREGLLSERPA